MNIKNVLIISLIFIFGASISCCKKNDGITNPDTSSVKKDSIIPPAGYKLVWNDEFNGTSIDTSKWNYEVNGDGGGNNELEYYTALPENSFIQDSCLIIKALKKTYNGKDYTSARLNSSGKGDWKYGRFEVRAKLPYGQGLWPAIWMLPTDWVYGGWPSSGEIDIMEELGHQANKVYGTIHYGNPHQQQGGNYTLPTGYFLSNFHVFALEWDSTSISIFVDSVKYFTTKITKPFDQRFHFVLNVAVGGNWPGSPDYTTVFPQQMTIDYVRVFQKISN
ncbi:MAG: glycoside hydrolase family 16 protein [Ignavibacteriaceae bacterium]|nr:glycoside hydrolase family 16 protein [Ignavibacteriaceae bacterium]